MQQCNWLGKTWEGLDLWTSACKLSKMDENYVLEPTTCLALYYNDDRWFNGLLETSAGV